MTSYVYLLIRAVITGHTILLPLAITYPLIHIYVPIKPRTEQLVSSDYDSKCERST
jgi:hypothetical protein